MRSQVAKSLTTCELVASVTMSERVFSARIFVSTALCASLSACSGTPPCFNQSSLILDPNVIAVRADPPESIVDLAGKDPVMASSIRALVVTPVYGRAEEYGRAIEDDLFHTTISICIPPLVADVNAQPGCPDDALVIGELEAVPTADAPFSYAPPLELIQKAVDQDPLHGMAGVQLTLQLLFSDGIATMSASKTLSYKLKGSPESVNHAIELIGMETSLDGVHVTVPVGLPVHIQVGAETGLRPLIGPGLGATSAIETYYAFNNAGVLSQFTEHVTYAFYAGNALYFGSPHNGPSAIYTGAPGDVADEPGPDVPDPPNGVVTVEGVFNGDQSAYFWMVARDGRGAVTWLEVPYNAKDLRPCTTDVGSFGTPQCPVIFFGCN